MLGWIFPLPLLVGIVGGCGSLADLWTNAGARLLCLAPAGAVPGIISILELSLDELRVCWSKLKINLMSPAIECSNEDTCRDNWSILALSSSTGRPGPLWKSPGRIKCLHLAATQLDCNQNSNIAHRAIIQHFNAITDILDFWQWMIFNVMIA